MPRRSVMAAILGLAAAVLLIACHPLVNPVDPRAINYTGVPTGSDGDTPDPILPSAVKWEIVTNHAGPMLPLEITEDGTFIEPRDAGWFELWITLSDSFEWEHIQGAVLWAAVKDNSDNTYYYRLDLSHDATILEQRRLGFLFDFPVVGIPNETRTRLWLVDRNGTLIGERVIGLLIGDVDANGTVDEVAENAIIASLEGFPVSTDDFRTIRADLDLDGVIEPNPGEDWNVAFMHDIESLPGTAGEFWD